MHKQITDAIDEHKQAEQALQKSFEKVEAYSQALNDEPEKGRQMQSNFLPVELLVKPGWEFGAYFKPARQVAGEVLLGYTDGVIEARSKDDQFFHRKDF